MVFRLTKRPVNRHNPFDFLSNRGVSEITTAPLADRIRPDSRETLVGQEHLLEPGKPLANLLDQRSVHSMILWGPPGTGKTTLARLLAENTDAHWIAMSAVLGGVKDVRKAIEEAEQARPRPTVLFVDEVHRFNKAQQDAFLPHVETGLLTLIGATTENPSFEVNSALLSRTQVYVLYRLTEEQIQTVVKRALDYLNASERLGEATLDLLCSLADGDARRALNLLETVLQDSNQPVSPEQLMSLVGRQGVAFDKQGDHFYDQISALHKSIRGSDPDASLYWFTRMIEGGCDPLYIARRLIRFATEDIGTADPRCLTIAVAARDAYHTLGSPEGELALAEAVVYFASVPKSNAVYTAFQKATEVVRNSPSYPVPLHLRNAPTSLAKKLGHGDGYRYAHNEDGAFAAGERYLPDEMPDIDLYEPTERGIEKQIKARLTRLRTLNEGSQH